MTVRDTNGNPIVNLARDAIRAVNPALTICPLGYTCQYPTDSNGGTTIGTVSGLGCVEELTVEVCGTPIGTVPIRVRSADFPPASPGIVDASDFAVLRCHLGRYLTCPDINGSGPTVDAADVGAWAQLVGHPCVAGPE